ncbi:MAG: hypothetical protein KF742_06445 [Cryobacterium sp.]|nr:hypothetical protein [Cryobacterium sp.]
MSRVEAVVGHYPGRDPNDSLGIDLVFHDDEGNTATVEIYWDRGLSGKAEAFAAAINSAPLTTGAAA